MIFSRGQTQVLYQFLPGAIFEHDQYGFCKVTSVEMQEVKINQAALFNAITDVLAQWPDDSFRPGFADTRHEPNRKNYVVGTPSSVRFKPYPTLLECRSCKRVYRLRDLLKMENVHPKHCPNCHGILGQLRYIQAHNCGRIEELYYPNPACPIHGTSFITFLDTGRVRSARWRCGACGNAEIGHLRMTPCTCAYSKSLSPQPSFQHERGLKTLALTDSAIFLPHIVPFINFDEDKEQILYSDPEILVFTLARTWGILNELLPDIIKKRRMEPNLLSEEGQTEIELVNALKQINPNHPLVLKWQMQREKSSNLLYNKALQRVQELLGSSNGPVPRQLIEHIAVLDTLHTTTIQDICGWMNSIGDQDGVKNLTHAQTYANETLGISNMMIINDFPIALCAVGYTRITRDPMRSILSPFETCDPNGRTPLYVVATETEGIYIQLDPRRVLGWLIDNGWCQGPLPVNNDEAWAWLYKNIPGLYRHRWENDYDEPLAIILRTLLHTISHILLRHVEWSGFNQNSVGEYLLPGALAFVLYANRYAETKIGGLTTLFEQRLGIWLEDSAQSGRDCVYDPFCTDEGGTCVGCLHREYNCPQFNRELSRAVLYGGPTPTEELGGNMNITSVRRGFWEFIQQNVK